MQHDDGTPYGYIGTAAWREDQAAERRIGRMLRIAENAYAPCPLTMGEGRFDDVAAPGGLSEPTAQPQYTGQAGDTAAVPMTVRRVARAGRLVRRAADRRAAVLAAARLRRRQAVRAAQAAQARQPLTLPPVMIDGVRPVDMITACEEHILSQDRNAAAVAAVMRHAPSNEGRGTSAGWEDAGTVNGTQVRHSRMWQSTPRALVMTAGETRDGVTCWHPVDWQCYRVGSDGSRTPLVSTATGKRRKRAAATAKQRQRDAAQALRQLAGTLGVEAQG